MEYSDYFAVGDLFEILPRLIEKLRGGWVSLRNIIVTLKVTPKPEEIRFDPVTKTIDRSKATNEINPADKNALEMALQLRDRYGGRVIVVSMGPLLGAIPQTSCSYGR